MVTANEGESLRILKVCKDFPSPEDPASRNVALDSVSLSLCPGELVSIIGPSGCGKSTLLRLAAGLDAPSSGQLYLGAERIEGPSAERGLVFQDPNLFPWLTVRRNIQAGLVARGLLHTKAQEVDEWIRLVGLESFAGAYPHQLSGGMAQRAALARALINHPKMLLLDEPLGALDAFTRMRMQDEVLRLWQNRRTTMLLVTHDIDEAIYMSDRIVIMTPRPGRVERNIDIVLERPRERNSPGFLRLRAEILEHLHLTGQAQQQDNYGGPLSSGAESAAPAQPAGPATAPDPAKPINITRETKPDAAVIIIGGGPAGSTLGSYLGQQGIDHIILEQAIHPRPHVGESLICSTTQIFQEIDFLRVMEQERFVRKYGAVWTHWSDEQEYVTRFREIPELGVNQDYTYHVDRGRFDELLLRHAADRGSRVMEGALAESVEFGPNGRALGVWARVKGERRLLTSNIVVDASGRRTLLGSQLRLKHHDAFFDQFAVHNWFEGVDRGPSETADFVSIHVLSMPRAWVWFIPINDRITSVGIVSRRDEFPKSSGKIDEFFKRQILSHPLLARRMSNAKAIHPFTRESNYSYIMQQFAGDGWLLVGDAARFVDPIFSSGISVAMESAKRAAGLIMESLGGNQSRSEALVNYERILREGVDTWREFILLYYQLPPLFFDVISRPEGRRELTRLLQGIIYQGADVPILKEMRRTVESVAANPDHPWHAQLSRELLS